MVTWNARHVVFRLVRDKSRVERLDDEHTHTSQVLAHCPPLEEWRKFLYVCSPLEQCVFEMLSMHPPIHTLAAIAKAHWKVLCWDALITSLTMRLSKADGMAGMAGMRAAEQMATVQTASRM